MSVRGTILDTLATQLATITTANGYNCDVVEVLRKAKNSEELSSPHPYLTIIDPGPDAIKQHCDGNKKRAEMAIIILAQAWGASGDNPPTGETSDIISDLRQLMESPISLGNNVCFVEVGDIPAIFTGDRRAAINFPINICYWFDADSP
jgi:hypothetical protein